MSLLLDAAKKVAEPSEHPPNDPMRRAGATVLYVFLAVVLAVLGIVGYGLYRAGHGVFGFLGKHGPHTVNAAAIDGKVRLGLPQAASQLMGATAPYNVTVKVDKGWGGGWKYLHGKWGNWNSQGSVGFDIDYSKIQPIADTQALTETLIMPSPQLLPASIHESAGKWTYVHCGTAEHALSVVSLGFDHACSIDSGDHNVRLAIDQAVAAQVPLNQAAMTQAERGAEQKFGPFIASIIKSVTGQNYTIKFVWPGR